MKGLIINRLRLNRNENHFAPLFAAAIAAVLFIYGCSDKPAQLPFNKAQKQQAQPVQKQAEAPPIDLQDDDKVLEKGYVYNRRDRRDPFVPLIVAKKVETKDRQTGTLESYDISEFDLAAIARKGEEYFALLVAPDKRSFTVYKGTVVGLSKGKVADISDDKVKLVEYSRDFRGKLRSRDITLELNKGEVK
jgi:type IV pilus assembly protein PilP